LRQIVEDIYILVVPRKTHRLAAVQIFFAGGVRRDYLIDYWGAGHGRKGGDRTMSWNGSKNIDLRKEGHADRLAKVLEKVPLASNPPTANAA
jgi:hypothetical protein